MSSARSTAVLVLVLVAVLGIGAWVALSSGNATDVGDATRQPAAASPASVDRDRRAETDR
jgi:hypothetical protein